MQILQTNLETQQPEEVSTLPTPSNAVKEVNIDKEDDIQIIEVIERKVVLTEELKRKAAWANLEANMLYLENEKKRKKLYESCMFRLEQDLILLHLS